MFTQSAKPSDELRSKELRSRDPYQRHIDKQPYLGDFMPRSGPVPDNAVKHFKAALADWLDEEAKLRAVWR